MSKRILEKELLYVEEILKENEDNPEKINNDQLFYENLYKLSLYLVNSTSNSLPFHVKEEMCQNVVFEIFKKVCSEDKKPIKSVKSYIGKCVLSELSKLNRNRYYGQTFIEKLEDLTPDSEFFDNPKNNLEMEVMLLTGLDHNAKKLIDSLSESLDNSNLPIDNKNLLLFPLILCICREDSTLLDTYPKRVKFYLKSLMNKVGDPVKYIRK